MTELSNLEELFGSDQELVSRDSSLQRLAVYQWLVSSRCKLNLVGEPVAAQRLLEGGCDAARGQCSKAQAFVTCHDKYAALSFGM